MAKKIAVAAGLVVLATGGWWLLRERAPERAAPPAPAIAKAEAAPDGACGPTAAAEAPAGATARPAPAEAQCLTGLDLVLGRGATVRGKILDAETAEPIGGARALRSRRFILGTHPSLGAVARRVRPRGVKAPPAASADGRSRAPPGSNLGPRGPGR